MFPCSFVDLSSLSLNYPIPPLGKAAGFGTIGFVSSSLQLDNLRFDRAIKHSALISACEKGHSFHTALQQLNNTRFSLSLLRPLPLTRFNLSLVDSQHWPTMRFTNIDWFHQ